MLHFSCQKFNHAWADCKQPSHCLWCGGSYLHRVCPKKTKSQPQMLQLYIGKWRSHPSTYRDYKLYEGRQQWSMVTHNPQCSHSSGRLS